MTTLYRTGVLGALVLSCAAMAYAAATPALPAASGSGPWSWRVLPSPPAAGSTVTVTVDDAPAGAPVTVTMKVGGNVVASGTITAIPGSVDLDVPKDTSGEVLEIIVSVTGSYDKHTTTIL